MTLSTVPPAYEVPGGTSAALRSRVSNHTPQLRGGAQTFRSSFRRALDRWKQSPAGISLSPWHRRGRASLFGWLLIGGALFMAGIIPAGAECLSSAKAVLATGAKHATYSGPRGHACWFAGYGRHHRGTAQAPTETPRHRAVPEPWPRPRAVASAAISVQAVAVSEAGPRPVERTALQAWPLSAQIPSWGQAFEQFGWRR